MLHDASGLASWGISGRDDRVQRGVGGLVDHPDRATRVVRHVDALRGGGDAEGIAVDGEAGKLGVVVQVDHRHRSGVIGDVQAVTRDLETERIGTDVDDVDDPVGHDVDDRRGAVVGIADVQRSSAGRQRERHAADLDRPDRHLARRVDDLDEAVARGVVGAVEDVEPVSDDGQTVGEPVADLDGVCDDGLRGLDGARTSIVRPFDAATLNGTAPTWTRPVTRPVTRATRSTVPPGASTAASASTFSVRRG